MYGGLKILIIVLLFSDIKSIAQQPSRPFPQHVKYTEGSIKPNHITQKQLDYAVANFYQQWKKRYIKPGCKPDEYYVWFERKGDKQCVSEGQGYGMVITALM